jgi:hypothetical protein
MAAECPTAQENLNKAQVGAKKWRKFFSRASFDNATCECEVFGAANAIFCMIEAQRRENA